MSRLSSFRGPSTPTSSPVPALHPSASSPSNSVNRSLESTYHRKVRTLLLELRTCCRTWDDLVLHDGLRAAKSLVDARTDLDNALAVVPDGQQLRIRLVGPKLAFMDERIEELDTVIAKLRKQFRRMTTIVENFEPLVAEAHKTKGWKWVHEDPLWTTWPLEKFAISIPSILRVYHRELEAHVKMVDTIRPHSVLYDASREIIAEWVAQAWLEDDGWDAKWEGLCECEVERWDTAK